MLTAARRLATQKPLCEIVPARWYSLALVLVFVVSVWVAYAAVPVINVVDWVRTAQQLRLMWHGASPYCDPFCEVTFDPDLAALGDFETTQAYSPWILLYFGNLAYASTRTVIALSVALWVLIVLDAGNLPALLLLVHPAFIMLEAAGNIDFLVNGAGLWLIFLGVRGWRRGCALMLMAIKPQVLPLLLLLEGVRALLERDWECIAVMGAIGIGAVALFPAWLTETVPTYFDVMGGNRAETGLDETTLAYSFSVLGAWGTWAALGVTTLVLLVMRRRLTEWRTLAVLLSFVWSPFVSPISFAVLLVLMRNTPAWRNLVYVAASIALLPVLFQEYHTYERYGMLLFLLMAAALSVPDADQTEAQIAARSGRPLLPRFVHSYQ